MSSEVDPDEALAWVLEKLAATKKPPGTITPIAPLEAPALPKKPKDMSSKKATELEMFHQWNSNGRKAKDLDPLLKSFQPLIQSRVNLYKNRVEIPVSAIEMEHKRAFVRALETWDPKKGGALGTWVTTNLRKAGRYVDSNKNFARITENVYKNIGSFNAVKSELAERIGHEPDAQTIHDHLILSSHPKLGKLSLKDVQRLMNEQRKGLIDKGHETDLGVAPNMSSREEEVILLIPHELTPQERSVHELTFGKLFGKDKNHSPGEIAKLLKMDNSKVSKLRTSIYKKMQKYGV